MSDDNGGDGFTDAREIDDCSKGSPITFTHRHANKIQALMMNDRAQRNEVSAVKAEIKEEIKPAVKTLETGYNRIIGALVLASVLVPIVSGLMTALVMKAMGGGRP